MYTAELLPATLAAARQAAHGPVKRALDRLRRVWREGIGDDDTLAPGHAPPPVYRACDAVPLRLLAAVQGVVQAIAQVQADEPALLHAAVQDMHFEALHFLALAESFGPHALFDSTQPPSGDARVDRAGLPPTLARPARARASGAGEQLHIPIFNQQYPSTSVPSSTENHVYPDLKKPRSTNRLPTLCIRNVIPAPYLAERHGAARVSVLFSGTLGPPGFYRDLLGLPEDTPWLDVPAPFAASQLAVHVVPAVSTRWRDRARSLTPIVDLVARQWRGQPGNYLCFFSSFDYLRQAAARMRERHPDLPLFEQSPAMDDAARAAFLARFVPGGQAMAFVVLGGAFSEGVDLPGSRLVGAFVATLGLPQFNPVNEQMRHAMAGRFGAARAHDYTYLYPGLRKVVQAAGRVIRTEHDRGTVHLIDDRYARPAVQALLPAWWRLRTDGGSASGC
jgi:DNA excision repair protein ERCC-2